MITNLGFLTAEEFVQRRSTTLLQDPEAKLQEKFEVDSYISKLSSQYLDEIESLSLENAQPLSPKVKIIITIIAYNEGTKILKTLNNYLNQALDPSLFEIIILDNHPYTKSRDNTQSEVQKFMNENPNLTVVYAYKIWKESDAATVGNARKHVFDIALARLHKRGEVGHETILVSNDADTVAFEPNYLSAILQEFEVNDVTDALVTRSVVPFKTIIKPNIYGALSLWDALDEYVSNGEPYNLMGASSAYRASIYAAVGGFNPKSKQAEDLESGWLIADARNWNPLSVIQLKTTKNVKDPRRILESVASRVPINEMYFDFDSKPEIRQADNAALLLLIPNYLDWELFEEDADSFWQGRSTGMYKWRGERFSNDFRKSMEKIGVEYEIVNDRVKLINLDKFIINYQNDFGEKTTVVHSAPRIWNQSRQDDMKKFFFSISDSIISARAKMAEKLAFKLKSLDKGTAVFEREQLLNDYYRFAGKQYIDD